MYDVAVIGGSAIGSRTAKLIADGGHDVLLIEEHGRIGLPSKCTGLVSHRLLELIPNPPKDIILNKIKSAKFFSPNGNCLELSSTHPVYVIDRTEFDRYLLDKASENSEVKMGERFESFKFTDDSVMVKTDKDTYYSKVLIGADGSNSAVRRQMGISQKSILGLQATVKGKFDPDSVELWFGHSVCPNLFAWVVPLDEKYARVGLATNENTMRFYDNFLKKRIGYSKKPDVVGRIPYGLTSRTSTERVMLVGDAASQVKPFSGGGIIYGLIASDICVTAAKKSLEENKFDRNFFKNNYDKKWKKQLAIPIVKGLFLKKTFNLMPNKGLNISFYFAGHLKRFLENWDMDLL